ncbi:MAG: TM2 domain-containing protein [Sphingobacteriales bacterium]|nr:MAG: TM2 domain-containing protein [Sphingobacteriales bacterium]
MDAQQMMMLLPGMQPDELMMIQSLTKDYSENELRQFLAIYSGKRKEPQQLLILTLIGFLGIAGIQRFVIGETGMGILYLLTCGFCGIGTIVDLVNNNQMAAAFNQRQAYESAQMMKMMNNRG